MLRGCSGDALGEKPEEEKQAGDIQKYTLLQLNSPESSSDSSLEDESLPRLAIRGIIVD